MDTSTAPWNDVLDFWFPEGRSSQIKAETHRDHWSWRLHGGADDAIIARFTDLTSSAASGDLDDWASDPEGRLALIIVLDQFSRSLWRGTPRAFAQDPAALSLALVAMRRRLETARSSSRAGLLARLLEWAAGNGALFVLVVPPTVIGAGWFILLLPAGMVFAAAPVMVVAVNAVMAMPFAVRAIRPAYDAAADRHDRLCLLLGLSGWNRLRLVDWPSLRRPLATAFAFAMALSLGDLGVIALFGSDQVQTLPYLLLARMGSYRTQDAAGLALLLGLVCLLLVFAADWLGKERNP